MPPSHRFGHVGIVQVAWVGGSFEQSTNLVCARVLRPRARIVLHRGVRVSDIIVHLVSRIEG